tara:strand:+ start:322 stop:489 length:168 start_codon:yes stop_codon:yes gene_type:complete
VDNDIVNDENDRAEVVIEIRGGVEMMLAFQGEGRVGGGGQHSTPIFITFFLCDIR